ncbi:unnamed protein product [Urochloa humidicola]
MWPGTSAGIPPRPQQHGQQQPRPSGGAPAFQQALLAAPPQQPVFPLPPDFLQQQQLAQQQYLAQQQQLAQQQFLAQQQSSSTPPQQLPWTPWTGAWDSRALANSFSTMTLNPPSSPDWVVDSGASTHMTPDSGSSLQERDSKVQ